jgi:hypothetical protein
MKLLKIFDILYHKNIIKIKIYKMNELIIIYIINSIIHFNFFLKKGTIINGGLITITLNLNYYYLLLEERGAGDHLLKK